MNKLKIFWIHPRIRDYRVPLFKRMAQEYSINFLLETRDPIYDKEEDFCVTYLKKKNRFFPYILNFKDIYGLFKGIKQSDVFVTSFLLRNTSIWGIVIAKIFNKKTVVWEENWAQSFHNIKSQLRYYISKVLAKWTHSFYVMGDPQKSFLINLGVKPEKIFVAAEYTGIDFGATKQKKVDYITFNKKNLLYFGRFVKYKGIEYIIDAFDIIENEYKKTDFMLNIIGFGPLEAELKNKACHLNLQCVKFYPPIFDPEEKSYLFSNSYIGIISSIIDEKGYAEGGPMVLLEYISAGLPVIGSNVIGHVSFFEKYNIGGVVQEKSARAIADEIIYIDDLISEGHISKESVRNEFLKMPGFDYQFKMLHSAINYAVKK